MKTNLIIKDSGTLIFPLERQFHVLQHFCEVDKDYLKILKENGYIISDIKEQFSIIGSKFHSNFSTNPLNLLDQIAAYHSNIIQPVWIGDRCELVLPFSEQDFPYGIGTDTLISIEELTDKEKRNIRTVQRGSFSVKSLSKQAKSTWQLNIIITKQEDKVIVITIFPGKLAPPFPDKDIQNQQQYYANLLFWENHVLAT